jgi:hypothetical protein
MKKNHSIFLGALVLVQTILFLQPAEAANYTFNETFDLSLVSVDNEFYPSVSDLFFGETSPPSFQLNVGDTLSGTISFANDQQLGVAVSNPVDPNYFNFLIPMNDFTYGTILTYTESVTLLGVQGNLVPANPDVNEADSSSNGAINVGEDPLTTSSVSFSGFDYSITLTSAPDDSSFTPGNLVAVGDDVTASEAPEPASWALILCGAGSFAYLSYRRSVNA